MDIHRWQVGAHKLKRFKFGIFNKLCKLQPSVLALHDIGFLRFDDGWVSAVYLVCYYAHDGNPGFVKFVKDNDEFKIDSYYHTISKILEVRYTPDHKIIAEYVNYMDNGARTYLKLVDGVKADEYKIDLTTNSEFPTLRTQIGEYVETDTNYFQYFRKTNADVLYLQIK